MDKKIYYYINGEHLKLTTRDYSLYEFFSLVSIVVEDEWKGTVKDFYIIEMSHHNKWWSLRIAGKPINATTIRHDSFVKKPYYFFEALGVIK